MKLQIADELHELLSTNDVQRLIAARNTTDVRCVVCGEEVPAASPETAVVLVSEDAIGGVPVAQFAHERCAESGFTGERVALSAESTGRLVSRFRVREYPHVPAVLLWEPYEQLTIGAEDLHTRIYRWLGLRPSRRGVLGTSGPRLQTLTVKLGSAHASVALTAQGVKVIARKVPDQPRLRVKEMDGFSLSLSPSVVEWRRAAERTGRCLLVTGPGLGLEHPSLEREDVLLEDGRALVGVAPVRIEQEGGSW